MRALAVAAGAAFLITGLAIATSVGRPETQGRTRDIVIEEMRFRPDRIDVRAGETISLRVVNRGFQRHDLHFQSGHMPGLVGVQAILEPGETRTITLRFDAPGTHVFSRSHRGLAAAGMTGAVFVAP